MTSNGIRNNQVLLCSGELRKDFNNGKFDLELVIQDEYVKAKNYQNLIRDQREFAVGGNLLYMLLTEQIEYINRLLDRIRLEDLNLKVENKALLFLKKFSRSSTLIDQKLKNLNTLDQGIDGEIFILHIRGMEGSLRFTRQNDGNSRLSLVLPGSYLFNRLISFMDQMIFTDINRIDKAVRSRFISEFSGLHQRVGDQKNHIEMKYALELAQERAQDLERENAKLMERIDQLRFQNDLYKRSYFSMKNRARAMLIKISGASPDQGEEELEELPAQE